MKKRKLLISWLLILATLLLSFASCKGEDLDPLYTVEFMADGAVYETKTIYSTAVLDLPDTPHKEGYTFLGWFWDNETFVSPFNAETLKEKAVGTTHKVYAAWAEGSNSRLATPTGLKIEEDILSWDPVVGATSYVIDVAETTFTSERPFIDLAGKITAQGRYPACVKAVSQNENVADSAWSSYVTYVVDIKGTQTGSHKAFTYGLGYGYDIVNSAYYDAKRTLNSPFDLDKLEAYVGDIRSSQSYKKIAKGETIADYMQSYSTAIGVNTGAEGQYKCFTASASMNFEMGFSARQEGHNYQMFCTYFDNVFQDGYAIKNCSVENYRNMLSNNFLREIKRESASTRGMGDSELADWLIGRYGTHIVTGLYLGGRIEISYYITAVNESVGAKLVSKYEAATSGGVSGMLKAHANIKSDSELEGSASAKESLVTMEVTAYGGESALAKAVDGAISEENYRAWAASLNERPDAVSLAEQESLLPLHVLIPEGEEYGYDDLRDALYEKYRESANNKYNSILAKYSFEGSTETSIVVDLTDLYDASENDVDVMSSSFSDTHYDKNTGIFTLKGYEQGIKITRYVFKGLYQAKNKDGDTCKNILKNFSICIDAEDDIEIVLENVSFRAVEGKPAIYLNPQKASEQKNITITLTVNGESRLMGSDGANATAPSANGKDGCVGIDFSTSENAKLIIGGAAKLTVIGGNGGNGANGSSGNAGKDGNNGGNGGAGALPISKEIALVVNSGEAVLQSGNGGNGGKGGDGGIGVNGKDGESYYYSGTIVMQSGQPGSAGGKGGDGGNGGNGGKSNELNLVTNAVVSSDANLLILNGSHGNGGDGGNGGKGGNGGTGGSCYHREHIVINKWYHGGKGGDGGLGGLGGKGGDGTVAGKAGQGGFGGLGGIQRTDASSCACQGSGANKDHLQADNKGSGTAY